MTFFAFDNSDAVYRACNCCTRITEIRNDLAVPTENHDCHAVVETKFSEKVPCCTLHESYVFLCGTRYVQQHQQREGLFGCGEMRNLLFHSIFIDREVFGFQRLDRSRVWPGCRRRHRYQIAIEPDG